MLGIISDTHDNLTAVDDALEIFKKEGVKLIIHLGDIISPFTLRKFQGFQLQGIFGNNDGDKVLLQTIAGDMGFRIEDGPLELEIQGKKFLLVHGYGSVERTKKLVESFVNSGNYDFVLYGHTHQIDVRRVGHTLVLNPGEACGYLTGKRSLALLDVESSSARIITF